VRRKREVVANLKFHLSVTIPVLVYDFGGHRHCLAPVKYDERIQPDSRMEDYAQMQRATCLVIVLISVLVVFPSRSQTTASADIDAIRQLEQTMGSAMVAGDATKLNQIYATDFAAIASDRTLITKGTLLAEVASSNNRLAWFEDGPINVQVFGNVALAQGYVKEKRNHNGHNVTSQSLWQDLLQKRNGNWVVWRSAGAKVVLAEQPNAQFGEPDAVTAIKEFENKLGEEMVANNIEKINKAYADDWATITSTGELFTKNALLQDFRSGNHKLRSFKDGPMNVQVLGDIAVVQTSVTEQRIQDGKDISGLFVFMDLLKKRRGKWLIVRTLAARAV